MKVHAAPGSSLDTTFEGDAPEAVTYHAPCHLRAQNIGLKSRDLMQLTGARVSVVAECSAVDGTWGLRAENLHASRRIAQKMATAIDEAGSDTVAGDCRLAATAIVQETGHVASHPLQVVARAYGIEPEPHATSR
jgi:Fe-S oxidoreductase